VKDLDSTRVYDSNRVSGLLTWVYHIRYSTLSSLVRIHEGIHEANNNIAWSRSPRTMLNRQARPISGKQRHRHVTNPSADSET
jgi:hypothetical protein